MPRAASKPRLRLETAQEAFARTDGLCECGCGWKAETWHHVFRQQNWPELADDVDNIVAVARRCHEQHHTAARRLPRHICWRAESLADFRMLDHLDRIYGPLGD